MATDPKQPDATKPGSEQTTNPDTRPGKEGDPAKQPKQPPQESDAERIAREQGSTPAGER